MVGSRFGLWTVADKWRGEGRRYYVRVVCECGAERVQRADTITSGRSRSCGCARGKHITERGATTKHNGKRLYSKEYTTWKGIRGRCNTPTNPKYPRYGGRGVKVCARWDSFEAFLEDMGPRPEGMTIGRIDNDGDYAPENCRWETPRQQSNNTRRNIRLSINGQTKTLAQWARAAGLKVGTLQRRYHAGWSAEDIINPVEEAL